MRDPIVEEVRKHRMEHTQEFGGDLAAICKNLRSIQEATRHTMVRLPARKRRVEKRPSPREAPPA